MIDYKLNNLKCIYVTLKHGGTYKWLKGNKVLPGDLEWLSFIITELENKGYSTYGGGETLDIILDKCKLPRGGYGTYTAVFLNKEIKKQYDMI